MFYCPKDGAYTVFPPHKLLTPAKLTGRCYILGNLLEDVDEGERFVTGDAPTSTEQAVLDRFTGSNDPASKNFEPTIVTSWDQKGIHLLSFLETCLLKPYTIWVQNVVCNKTDVVFLIHTFLHLFTALPSALFRDFLYTHALCHWIMIEWYSGVITLMLHNYIHKNGVLAKSYVFFDRAYPFILEPLMDNTWNSYFYHHVKHYYSGGNKPNELSSTVCYCCDQHSYFL